MNRKTSIGVLVALSILSMGLPPAVVHAREGSATGESCSAHRAVRESLDASHQELVRARTQLRLAAADELSRTAPEDRAADQTHVRRELGRARAWLEKALACVPEKDRRLADEIRSMLDELEVLAAKPSIADAPQEFRHLERRMWSLLALT